MHQQGVGDFQYYVGISSLSQGATRHDRVCVLNILGGESSEVTPVSHVVRRQRGVRHRPGQNGQTLETSIGPVPVFNSVREGLDAGHRFNCGVVPAAHRARDGVAELIRVNPELRRSSSSPRRSPCMTPARSVRWASRPASTSLAPTALAWPTPGTSAHRRRAGRRQPVRYPQARLDRHSLQLRRLHHHHRAIPAHGRLGHHHPGVERQDIYIHYAAPEFAFALANDARSKAAVLYCEPGGYYERDADFTKPVVACVVGRWKSS